MASNDLRPPQGLSLNPTAPVPVRVTKLAGVIGIAVIAGVLLLIVFGAMKRRQSQAAASTAGASRETSALQDSTFLKDDLTKATQTVPVQPYTGPIQDTPELPASEGMSPEEQRRAVAYQQEQAAVNAPSKVEVAFPISAVAASAQDPQGGYGSQGMLRSGGDQDHDRPQDQNAQDQKLAFLNSARQQREDDYLKSTRAAQLGPYEIKAGWDIPAVLEEGINSDLPGEIKALVRANVYDTATGKYLLIPQGARLVGKYSSAVTYGQSGVQAVWTRVIYPDGSSLDLAGMNGTDAQGNSGFRAKVDNHYGSLIGGVLLSSILAAGLQLSQNTTGGQNVLVTPTPAQATAQAIGQQVTQLGAAIASKSLNRQPTIKIPIGYRFNVRVNRDMVFDAPYQPYR
jgi:type IV secretion system protein VirB10